MEGLCEIMSEDMEKNLFSSFCVRDKDVQVYLLQYADDTLFVGEATLSNVVTIKNIHYYKIDL